MVAITSPMTGVYVFFAALVLVPAVFSVSTLLLWRSIERTGHSATKVIFCVMCGIIAAASLLLMVLFLVIPMLSKMMAG